MTIEFLSLFKLIKKKLEYLYIISLIFIIEKKKNYFLKKIKKNLRQCK